MKLRANRVEIDEEQIKFIYGEPFGYRSRMDFIFSEEGPGQRKRKKYNVIVPIETCPIANTKVNTLLGGLWRWFQDHRAHLHIYDLDRHTGWLKYAVVRASSRLDSSSVTFIVNGENLPRPLEKEIFESFLTYGHVDNVLVGRVHKMQDLSTAKDLTLIRGTPFNKEKVDSFHIKYHSQSFFQNNPEMVDQVVEYLREQAVEFEFLRLLDLYGGAGTFGVALGYLFESVIIMDSDERNIRLVEENGNANGFDHVDGVQADADAIASIPYPVGRFSLLVDPPRFGLGRKLIRKIGRLAPRDFVYVSCNPMLLAEEIRELQTDYFIRDLRLFDMFPQTRHMEAVAVMRRKK